MQRLILLLKSIKHILIGLWIAFLVISTTFASPSIQQIDEKIFTNNLLNIQETIEPTIKIADMQLPNQTGKITISAMFSAQHGSWPFESFAINNLFRVIATYQANHPRMITIKGGTITLEQLNSHIKNQQIIRPFQDGYLLSYPLLIEDDAALLLENTSLYLYGHSGTAIINKGLLSIQKANVESWFDNKPAYVINNTVFRPFIINWGGSRLQIIDSTFAKLGYNAYLVQGITTAINNNQPTKLPIQVEIKNSNFTALSSLNLKNAIVSIDNTTINTFQQYGVDLIDSQFNITNNKIQAIKNNSGIRVQGNTQGIIENNAILTANKSAIEAQLASGNLIIRKNILAKDSRHGVLLTHSSANVLIKDNLFTKLTGTAIESNQFSGSAYILDNTIQDIPEYAVSFRNLTKQENAKLIFYNNKIAKVSKPILRTIGIGNISLGHNKLLGSQLYQNLLIGDLLPIQGTILEATQKYDCIVEVKTFSSTESNINSQACK